MNLISTYIFVDVTFDDYKDSYVLKANSDLIFFKLFYHFQLDFVVVTVAVVTVAVVVAAVVAFAETSDA